MLTVGQIIELTHGVTHQKSPHVIQLVTDGSARAVPLSYRDADVASIPNNMIASISPNASVRTYTEEEIKELLSNLVVETLAEGGMVIRRKRGRPRKTPLVVVDPNAPKRKRGRPRKTPLPIE